MEDEPLPKSDIDALTMRFIDWDGTPPAPQFTHWTPAGTIVLRPVTPRFTTEVIWQPKGGPEVHAGYGPPFAASAASLIKRGEHDKTAGVKISDLVPDEIEEWNNLGG